MTKKFPAKCRQAGSIEISVFLLSEMGVINTLLLLMFYSHHWYTQYTQFLAKKGTYADHTHHWYTKKEPNFAFGPDGTF